MKKLVILGLGLLLLLPLVNLGAEEVIGYVEKNRFLDRLDVIDDAGKSNYYLEKDRFIEGRWIIYHKDNGHKAGVIDRNPLRLYSSDIKMKAPTNPRVIRVYPDREVRTKFRRFTK